MRFIARVVVTFKPEVPISPAKETQIRNLAEGEGVDLSMVDLEGVVEEKFFDIVLVEDTQEEALEQLKQMCQQLLANSWSEDYEIISIEEQS